MKYLIKHKSAEEVEVKIMGEEEKQICFTNLAESIFNTPVKEDYDGRIATFSSLKQLKNLLFWRAIFNQHRPNRTFSFLKYAKVAAREVQYIFKNEVVYC